LPTLHVKLESLSDDIHNKRGFFVVRGLGSNKYGLEDDLMRFLGLSSYIGDKRAKQDDEGNMLGEDSHGSVNFLPVDIDYFVVHLRHYKDTYASGKGPTRYSNKASVSIAYPTVLRYCSHYLASPSILISSLAFWPSKSGISLLKEELSR
jgi:hypothetical protein